METKAPQGRKGESFAADTERLPAPDAGSAASRPHGGELRRAAGRRDDTRTVAGRFQGGRIAARSRTRWCAFCES